MLLTDEEIAEADRLVVAMLGFHDHSAIEQYRIEGRTIAKAQLKKVVDIIRQKQAYIAIVSQTGNEVPFFNPIDWEEIWQSLLDGVK